MSFFPLGGASDAWDFFVTDENDIVLIFSNGDKVKISGITGDLVDEPGYCLVNGTDTVHRAARHNGKVKWFPKTKYVCDGPVLEMEAQMFPNPNAYAVVYDNACGGIAKGVRISAQPFVDIDPADPKYGWEYSFNNPTGLVLKQLKPFGTHNSAAKCLIKSIVDRLAR